MRSGNRSEWGTMRSGTGSQAREGEEFGAKRQAGGAARLAALSALVDELGDQIDAMEGATRRGDIQRGIRAAAAPHNRTASPPPAPQPETRSSDAERLANIEARIASIGKHLAAPQQQPPKAPPAPKVEAPREPDPLAKLQSAIAEISARQSTIDHDERSFRSVDTIALEDAIARLRDDISGIGRRVAAEHRPAADTFSELRQNIAEIRQSLDLTAREATLASLESGYGHIVERLDDIVRRVPERSRIDEIAREIARLAASAEKPVTPPVVEGELEDIRNALASLAASRAEDSHRPDLSPIERTLAGIRQDIDNLARSVDPRLVIRLEGQLDAIRSKLDAQPAHNSFDNSMIARLEDRLDALAGRFDALVDLPGLKARHSNDAIDLLRNEVTALRNDIAERELPRFDSVETQMRALVERLDAATHRDDGSSLNQLEAQVGALAAQFSENRPSPVALAKVEENLDRLESLLGDTRRETIEAARDAARTTFQEFAGSMPANVDDRLIGALRDDLRALQSAAQRSDRQTHDTLGALHDTLAKVVERIAQIEGSDTGALTTSMPATNQSIGIDATEDYRPLAPGSGKPNPANPRQFTPDNRPAAGDRKADFIAAARRAAQAAQAETALARLEGEADHDDEDRPSALARIGQAFRSRRRPLVLAIAAIVLAIGAAQLGPTITEQIAKVTSTPATLDPAPTGSVAPRPMSGTAPAQTAPSVSAEAPLVAPSPDSNTVLAFQPADPIASYLSSTPTAPPATAFAPIVSPATGAETVINVALVQDAADKGDGVAAFELAQRYANGDGVTRDGALAASWYERAAKAGIAIAQYRLGSLYEHGEGVKQSNLVAQDWYEKASAAGNARATHNLAVLMSEGANGQPDFAKAAQLFAIAADLGVADSQYNLGVLYARGLGVGVNLVQSYTWFALAAQQGDQDAGKRRDEVAKAMTADDLAKARSTVQAFQAKPLDMAANSEPTPRPAWFTTPGRTSMLTPASGAPKG